MHSCWVKWRHERSLPWASRSKLPFAGTLRCRDSERERRGGRRCCSALPRPASLSATSTTVAPLGDSAPSHTTALASLSRQSRRKRSLTVSPSHPRPHSPTLAHLPASVQVLPGLHATVLASPPRVHATGRTTVRIPLPRGLSCQPDLEWLIQVELPRPALATFPGQLPVLFSRLCSAAHGSLPPLLLNAARLRLGERR